jgi:hypothetical protein
MKKNNHDHLVRMITEQVIQQLDIKGFTDNSGVIQPAIPVVKPEPGNTREPDRIVDENTISGIVTARKLEDCRAIKISKNSIITPSAKDFIKENKIIVRMVEDLNASDQNQVCGDAAWYYWSACSLLKNLHGDCQSEDLISCSTVNHGEENSLAAVKDLDQAISLGKVKGGILVARTSARVTYLTSRFQNMRTVVGSFPKTIEDGIQQFDANVLILEHAHLGRVAMTEMMKQFITARRSSNLLDITDALEGC